jgi:3-phenylpropionate/trans-cinnamate dioxygenase ferredoxin subunit
MAWVKLADMDDLQDEVLACEQGDEQIALFLVDGNVYAAGNVCTHDYALLTDGFLEDGCIECPLHAARFDVRTGEAQCGPAKDPLKVYSVEIRGSEVWVDV